VGKTNALMRSMMMREAIASCGIEGAIISEERAKELIELAAADEIETWQERDARLRHTPGNLLAYALDEEE
jgi:hypothetical protein